MSTRTVLQTSDHVAIVGTFMTAEQPKGAALLLHMMPADRNSWQPLQEALRTRGIASLAIDLRGHGESVIQGNRRLDYHKFSDHEHGASLQDVEAALVWLTHHGFSLSLTALIGASIGANLALVTAAEKSEISAVALLSPGENYRGVQTFGAARQLRPDQSLWVTASQGDDQESFEASQEIMRMARCVKKEMHPYTGAGHGTVLFQTDGALVGKLADWIRQSLAKS